MSEASHIEIVEYSDGIAAGIDAMFNSWDELWIGGFTQGVPHTEERVKKTYSKMRSEVILIAVDTQSKHPVGLCSLLQHWVNTKAAYIGLLGNHERTDRPLSPCSTNLLWVGFAFFGHYHLI